MKRAYLDKSVPKAYTPIIADANRILRQFAQLRMKITLRGLYYRFIAGDLLPDSWIDDEYNAKNELAPGTKNTQKNYKRLGNIIAEARMCGLIDWDLLEDSGRQTDQQFHYDDYDGETPGDMIRSRGRAYFLHRWSNSPYHVEVMVEKDAIEGIIGPVAERYDVPFTSNRGYSSITAQRNSGLRLKEARDEGKKVVVLYVGDHDPSGLDMTTELEYKLRLFSEGPVEMRRLALTMEQIELYNPPPNPAKTTDSRSAAYIEEHGTESWEVDALDPTDMANVVEEAILEYWDTSLVDEIEEREREYQERMDRIAGIVDQAMEDAGE